MVLGGNGGFDAASSASIENGKVVLSSGWSIADDGTNYSVSSPVTADASVDFDTGNYTSNLFAIARGDIIAAAATGSIDFAGSVNFNTYDAADTGNVIPSASAGNNL